MVSKFVVKAKGPGMAAARHSMLTPVELLPNFKTSEAAKRYHIFVTVYTSLLLIIRKKNISPSTLIRIRAARMKRMEETENDESFPTRGNMHRLKCTLRWGRGGGGRENHFSANNFEAIRAIEKV
ncbi:hypothetical protein AVEN_157660-1 [Araneus ventricosus]|uniref:Uncharacterized protein n=1 Tax=Araneus ventricosus TaxID=182803 RepID=A0A4Y2IPV5_ARAVE|nr:hypothetical protein AVEN_157660-1 [Araneus ventricosus]